MPEDAEQPLLDGDSQHQTPQIDIDVNNLINGDDAHSNATNSLAGSTIAQERCVVSTKPAFLALSCRHSKYQMHFQAVSKLAKVLHAQPSHPPEAECSAFARLSLA